MCSNFFWRERRRNFPIQLTSLSLSESLMCWAMNRTDWIAASTSDVSRFGITICSCSVCAHRKMEIKSKQFSIALSLSYKSKALTMLMMSHIVAIFVLEIVRILGDAVTVVISDKTRENCTIKFLFVIQTHLPAGKKPKIDCRRSNSLPHLMSTSLVWIESSYSGSVYLVRRIIRMRGIM